MTDPQQTDAAPIGRIPDDPAIPTLNPADSPYKPVELPQEQSMPTAPPPEQRPPDNLGAVSHAGAAAYMIDQVLKGASHGYAVGQAYAADQYNKKLGAIQGIYNDQAQQMYQIAKEGRAGTFTGPAGPDGKPTFVPSPEFKQAQQRMLASWQAMMQVVGQRIPQTKKGKAKTAQQGESGAGADVTTLMQQAVDHKNDPQGALAATYQLGLKVGPPVVHQVAGFLTPEYVAQQQTAARTQNSQAAAGASTADTSATVADINNRLAHAIQSGASQDEIDKLIKQRDELNPSQRFPVSGVQRSGQGADGKWYEWRVDENNKEIPDTRRPLSTAGLGDNSPKVGSFGDFMVAAYGPKPTPKQYIEGQKAWAQSKAGTTVGTHTVMVTQGDKQVPFTFTTTSGKTFGGDATGVPDARVGSTPTTPNHNASGSNGTRRSSPASVSVGHSPVQAGPAIGYRDSPEYKALIKQATDAQKDFNSASTNLSTMLKTANDAKNGDGAAQVGIVSSYLKTVVGGQGTGVRITKPEWDAAVKTRPLLEGIKASFSPDGYLTGAVISPQQVDQMVNEVHQKTKALYETAQSTKQRATEQRQTDVPPNLQTTPPSNTPSLQPSSIDDEILNLVKH